MPAHPLHELTNQALTLPEADRLRLAQALWESLESDELPGYTDTQLREELQNRLRDQPDGSWKTHDEIMAEARRKFGCQK